MLCNSVFMQCSKIVIYKYRYITNVVRFCRCNGLYFRFIPIPDYNPLILLQWVANGFICPLWVMSAIFNAFCPLWVAYRFKVCDISIFAGCGLLFGLYGWIYAPPPHPQTENAKSGLPFQKFFFEILFFIFAFVIEVFKPVGVVSSFAGFFV